MKKTLEQELREAEKQFKNNPREFFGLASIASAYRVAFDYIKLLKKALRAEKRKVKELRKEASKSWQQKKREDENYNLLRGQNDTKNY